MWVHGKGLDTWGNKWTNQLVHVILFDLPWTSLCVCVFAQLYIGARVNVINEGGNVGGLVV